jgi:hypothetical protein
MRMRTTFGSLAGRRGLLALVISAMACLFLGARHHRQSRHSRVPLLAGLGQ